MIRQRTEQRLLVAQAWQEAQQQRGNPAAACSRLSDPGLAALPASPGLVVDAFAKSTMRSIGNTIGRQIVRGLLGSDFWASGEMVKR